MTTTVLIADDQEMARIGISRMISADPGLRVIAQAHHGREALELARATKPDVCLLDIRMPVLTGLEVTRQLMADADPPAIVMITTFDLDEYLFDALDAGASGFVLKDASTQVIVGAVHAAANGEALLSPTLTRRLIETYLQRPPRVAEIIEGFTPREFEVLRAVCDGLTNDQLAREFGISSSTVKSHVASLMRKTDTTNRVSLVIWAF